MERCRTQLPPHYATSPDRAVACFLYDEAPEVDVSEAMAARQPA
jgi:hypothetical protein